MKALLGPALVWALATGCTWNAAGITGCQPEGFGHPLPAALRESSGVAFSRASEGVLWTHNDGGNPPVLFALDREGSVLGTLRLRGARNRDWEDIATGSCGSESCIYVADVGDNDEVRNNLVLYRVVDPGRPGGTTHTPRNAPAGASSPTADTSSRARADIADIWSESRPVDAFPLSLPAGPRDIEALFVLPGEDVYLITKGSNSAVTVYHYPPPLRSGERVRMEEVQTLTDGSVFLWDRVTGADASPDGTTAAVRTYRAIQFYRVGPGGLQPIPGARVELRTLQEPQGEGVALGPDGLVALTTEAGSFGGAAALHILRCTSIEGS